MTALLKFTLSATFHYSGSLLSTQVSADLFRLNPKATVQLQVQPYRFVRYYEMHISRYSNNTNIQISIGKPIFSCRHPGMLSPHRTSLSVGGGDEGPLQWHRAPGRPSSLLEVAVPPAQLCLFLLVSASIQSRRAAPRAHPLQQPSPGQLGDRLRNHAQECRRDHKWR